MLGQSKPILREVVDVIRGDNDIAPLARVIRSSANNPKLWSVLQRHRLAPLWWQSVRTRPGLASLLATDLHDNLVTEQRRTAVQALLQEQMAVAAADVLTRAGISHVFYKAAHLRRTVYQPGSLRPADDIDLLVAPRERDHARVTLLSHGFSYADRAMSSSHEESLRWHGGHLDLHWGLLRPGRARIDPSDALLSSAVESGGLFVPSPSEALAALTLSTAISDYVTGRLIRAVDIDRLVRGCPIDWDTFIDIVTRARLDPAAWLTLTWVRRWMRTPVPGHVLAATMPGRVRRHYLKTWVASDPLSQYYRRPTLVRLCFSLALHHNLADAARALAQRTFGR